ncbi:UPF0158 family protein [Flavobacterium ovatum]|uniref:UPF0158 family protein n=1 Tax=Flavobacterium ovatum TaxID=1928857 RepID=UPI00344B5198
MKSISTDQIKEIAEHIDMGLQCYYNAKNNKLLFIPKDLDYDDDMAECWQEEIDTLGNNPKDFIEIEAPESHDSFRIMKDFTNSIVKDSVYQNQLFNILENRKPFANFKNSIENSSYSEDWFLFKNNWMIQWVESLIELNNEEFE